MVQRCTEEEQRQQNFEETENILLKYLATIGVRNYDRKSSGSPDRGAQRMEGLGRDPARSRPLRSASPGNELVFKQSTGYMKSLVYETPVL
ncbi:hypothetical protein TNCV_3477761 [Trichonephila clavipes]|nr:hypothetical protein TNCV_3477761 [Trichonephila clavipes]